jgi:hypothetical protein
VTATERYAEALATVADKTPLQEVSEPLCQAVSWHRRRVRGLNPLRAEDAPCWRRSTAASSWWTASATATCARCCMGRPPGTPTAAARTRQVRLLQAHRLIHKVPKSHRYQVSAHGWTVVAAVLAARPAATAKRTAAA